MGQIRFREDARDGGECLDDHNEHVVINHLISVSADEEGHLIKVPAGGPGSCIASSAKVKITEQSDQSRQDPSRIRAIKGGEQFSCLLGGTLGHDDDLSKPATPNQFGKRRIDAKCPEGERDL